MKKTLIAIYTLIALAIGIQATLADCPFQTWPNQCNCDPCMMSNPCGYACPCTNGATPPIIYNPGDDDTCYQQEQYNCKQCCNPCCENWLNCPNVENYFCRMGLNECQKAKARCAIEQFKFKTQCLRNKCNCTCESKCECRQYRKALRDLDCQMKNIITRCQKSDYNCVRYDVKCKVKCYHHCLIWPFYLCKCGCN